MTAYDIILIIAIPITVLFVFAYYFQKSRKILLEEEGKTPVFQEHCGGRFDSLNITIPFVRFSIYEDFFIVVFGDNYYIVKFDELEKIEMKHFLISNGIIIHRKINKPPFLFIIWSKSPQKVAEILKKKGVTIIFV